MILDMGYGAAHAMAAASSWSLVETCIALGLSGPYIPRDICKELDMPIDYKTTIEGK